MTSLTTNNQTTEGNNTNMTTELTTTDPTTTLELVANASEILAGASPDDINIPTIKFPSGGSPAWQLPGESEDTPRVASELIGTVVADYAFDALYLESYDDNPDAKPEAVWIAGQLVHCSDKAIEAGVKPGLALADQPLNQFGSAGKGKAISNRWSLFIIEQGEILPARLSVPPMSRKDWFNFRLRAFTGKPTTTRLLRFTLKSEKNSNGQPFSKLQVATVREYEPEEATAMAKFAEALRPLTTYRPPLAGDDTTDAPKVVDDLADLV